MWVTSAGADPNSVKTGVVPGVSSVLFQAAVLEGPTAGRLDIFWVSNRGLNHMGSGPPAIYNLEEQQMYIFWLNNSGKLNQTSPDAQGVKPAGGR